MPPPQLVNAPGGQILSTTSVNPQTAADTTLTPATTAGFPSRGSFSILVRETAELIMVNAVNIGTPTTWTVARGIGGSAAQAIATNAHLDYSITRDMLLGLAGPFQTQDVTAVSTITFSGLDLNTDLEYQFEFRGVWNGSFANGTQVLLYPNGVVPTGIMGQSWRWYTSSNDIAYNLTSILLWQSDFSVGTGGLEVWCRGDVRLGGSGRKQFQIENWFMASTTQFLTARNFFYWTDTATNITSLQITPAAGTLTGHASIRKLWT